MLALGQHAGLARDVLLDAFSSGAFATPSIVGKRNKLLVRDYAPEFSLALTQKDMASRGVARGVRHGPSGPRMILREVEAGVREGLGDLDLFALERRYER